MEKKLKEPRIYLCIGIIAMLFLPWVSVGASVDTGVIGSYDSSLTLTGLQMVQDGIFAIAVFLIPLAFVVIEFIPSLNINLKVPYLLGSLLGAGIAVFAAIWCKNAGSVSVDMGNSSAETSVHFQIGFWITIALFAGIIVITLIKDFALSKDTLAKDGLKGALNNVTSQISEEVGQSGVLNQMGNMVGNLSSGGICPSCGASVAIGKKFCTKCGTKMPESTSADMVKKPNRNSGGKVKSDTPATVKDYMRGLSSVSCEKCGATVEADKKFCPDCGEEIVLKASGDTCEKCKAVLIGNKKYCPDCGHIVKKYRLVSSCSNCGADLYLGKKYCVNCGTEVIRS